MIIENPDPELKAKWGPLAYVSETERQAILNLPFGCFKPEIQRLEKQIKDMEKRKKQKESDLKRLHRFTPG